VPKVKVLNAAVIQINWMVVVIAMDHGIWSLGNLKQFHKKFRFQGKTGLVQFV
jgi:hypothetical protein